VVLLHRRWGCLAGALFLVGASPGWGLGEESVVRNSEVPRDGRFDVSEDRVRRTEHLELRWAEGVPEAAVTAVADQGEMFYTAIRRLLGHGPARRIPVLLQGPAEPKDGTPPGYPRVDAFGRIHLYEFGGNASSYLSPLAHEMVHVFRFERRHDADWFFEEGFAELLALEVDPSLQGFPWYGMPVVVVAGQWFQSGEALPLEGLRENHERMNLPCKAQSYTLRSAFFQYLADDHGLSALIEMASRTPAGRSADYEEILGANFPTLEERWRQTLLREFESIDGAEELARRYREETPIRYMPVCAESDFGRQ